MSDFIVSARKYRPATFASVIGQKHITSTLKNAIERGQLAHAYLFCGPRGVGKTTCARIFAKAINCLSPKGAEACNECESCVSFNQSRALNIHELDAASNNSVDDIRTLIEQVRIIPQIGHYSVFIIDEVHMLSSQAFNAFLKTLEEPPAHAIFILATTEKHKIIPTILSRCQIYDFNRIRVEDSVEYLKYIAGKEGIKVDDESLNIIAQKADGGMRDALSMFDKAVSFCGQELNFKQVAQTLNVLDYDTYFSVTDVLLSGLYQEALLTLDRVLGQGFSGQTFMAGLNRHMRDLLVAKNPSTLPLLEVTGSLLEKYKAQAVNCSPEILFAAISILTEIDGKIRQSSNQRLLVELGLMKIAALGQKKNEPVTTENYALPELVPAKVTEPQCVSPQIVVQEMPNVKESPVEKPIEAPAKVAEPQCVSPQIVVTDVPTVKESPVEKSIEVPVVQPKPSPAPLGRPMISGASISELISVATTDEDEDEQMESVEGVDTDPMCAQKLEVVRTDILKLIQEKRPRFVAAFEDMIFIDNKISVSVPTTSLQEEILRNKTEILMRISELSGVDGAIELDVVVNEQIQAARPIKLEDRVKYMTEKNPMFVELRKALDLEVQ